MSLARTLTQAVTIAEEAAKPEFELINPADYGHEYGARIIAMETAEALHDVFLESFYGCEQADILAIKEGVALEGSQYEAIVEGLSVEAIDKIKGILMKLREKVKAFFDYIIRTIDKMTMDTSDFFKKHDAEFQQLKGLKDFKFRMYNYNDAAFESALEQEVSIASANAESALSATKEFLSNVTSVDGEGINNDAGTGQGIETVMNTMKQAASDEFIYGVMSNNKAKDSKTFREYAFGIFRNGAKSPDDKKDMQISDVYAKIAVVKNFNAENVKKVRQKMDSIYADAIGAIDTARVNVGKMQGANVSGVAEVCRLVSTSLSKMQNAQNAFVTEWSKAVKERDTAYKQMAMKAMSYVRKVK